MNLSTGRILIIVALVVVGLAVLANGFLDDGATVARSSGSAVAQLAARVHPPPVERDLVADRHARTRRRRASSSSR